MKDILYCWQYNFCWSRRYDAYALVKRDELVRCAFLMEHLLLSEWEGYWGGPLRSDFDHRCRVWQTQICRQALRQGSVIVEPIEGWRMRSTFGVNPAGLTACLAHWLTGWGWILYGVCSRGLVTGESGGCPFIHRLPVVVSVSVSPCIPLSSWTISMLIQQIFLHSYTENRVKMTKEL